LPNPPKYFKALKMIQVGVAGAGAMGIGIAQIAAQNGHSVVLSDTSEAALERGRSALHKVFDRMVEKGKIEQSEADSVLGRIHYTTSVIDFQKCGLVIEAIVERLDLKQSLFREIEAMVSDDCILATNTSSLSVTAIAAAVQKPERVVGIHFFNPAPLMPLVEIIPAVQTAPGLVETTKALIDGWGKSTVIAKDTPGFIVNRVARPFYGEALRIVEEGLADFATVDWAMKDLAGFRMGPFELMDLIGNDINYAVTESVFAAFYYDARYKPSFIQKRQVEAGWLGRKSGRGYYNYAEGAEQPQPKRDRVLGEQIVWRILVMLINEAADALHLGISNREGIDTAMTKGVNYPKGLLKWADERGINTCVETLTGLQSEYGEDRYRCSVLLRRMAREGLTFY
jgi:3-hydroxybutyryl-CoA dehydrogenase